MRVAWWRKHQFKISVWDPIAKGMYDAARLSLRLCGDGIAPAVWCSPGTGQVPGRGSVAAE